MKKEKLNYYDEFIKITKCIGESTILLKQLISNYDLKKVEEYSNKVHYLENQSDNIVHSVRKYLISDFLPPIDREDIGLLLHKLDNVEDEIDELVKNFDILNITEIKKKELSEYMVLLQDASIQITKVFKRLYSKKNEKEIHEETIRLNNIEDEADKLYEKFMRELYKKEKDAITIMKWTTLYNCLEELFDEYENVADCVDDILIKNS